MTQTQTPRTAILFLAYGTPDGPEDVEPYFTHIRHGRKPSPESVHHLQERYAAVGGRTPLTGLTYAVRDQVAAALRARGLDVPTYVGMRHWTPWIADVVKQMKDDGVERVIGVVLAPHYSRFSIGGYQNYLFEGMRQHDAHFDVHFVEWWYDRPEFVQVIGNLVTEELAHWPAEKRDDVTVVFSAHSLPERIRTWNDPYERQLHDSARLVAEHLGLKKWRVSWQSAGGTGEPWIGPDILDDLETYAAEGITDVLQCAIGFVCDHLEILYDLDLEAKGKSDELGITYRRTRLPNDRPDFIAAMTAICADAVALKNTVHVDEPPPAVHRPAHTHAAGAGS